MTSQTKWAAWPKGQSSESASTAQTAARTCNQRRKNKCPSATRAPDSGTPWWPETGACQQYGSSCSNNHRIHTASKMGKLTEASWVRTGLRPPVAGTTAHIGANNRDPPTPDAKFCTGLPRVTKRIFFQTTSFYRNLKHRSAKTFLSTEKQ